MSIEILRGYLHRIEDFRKDIEGVTYEQSNAISGQLKKKRKSLSHSQDQIYLALQELGDSIAASYAQVKSDLEDNDRISWAGTAHEIREIVSHMLRILAPDESILTQSWYKQEQNTSGPSQKQRVKFILQKQSGSSKQREVVEHISNIEGLVGGLVRATYSRASDAAHRSKDQKEATKLLRYFEAFAYDLLDIQ